MLKWQISLVLEILRFRRNNLHYISLAFRQASIRYGVSPLPFEARFATTSNGYPKRYAQNDILLKPASLQQTDKPKFIFHTKTAKHSLYEECLRGLFCLFGIPQTYYTKYLLGSIIFRNVRPSKIQQCSCRICK